MSLSWLQRKTKLSTLLKSTGDEDADGVALDRLLHGQNVIGKTSKTVEIDTLRFQDKDLIIVGTLEFGQYGVIDVVNCRLDTRTYVRKSTEKRFALRSRDQCFPQFERDILLQASKTESKWAPHLLCAFQTQTHLNLVMDYAEGGSLWDVLESSPQSGKLPEADLQWWIPQIVSAIHWCHVQGFAHRDIKPQNFVLKQDAHILLIDFGSAAPLLPPLPDGTQLLPKRYCLLPCGTCDYISPEILEAHEAALVALEMDDDDDEFPSRHRQSVDNDEHGYGVETDWWSLGAMLYEMAYGFTPFFANEIRHTYQKIMNHERSLRFDENIPVSSIYKDFLRKLLTHPERRLGRKNIKEIMNHPLFESINWSNLHKQPAPEGLHLPQFTYNEPVVQTEPLANSQFEESLSQGFAFSALFQSSPLVNSSSHGPSILRPTPAKSAMQEDPSAAFIGFSWGPTHDAFPSNTTILSPPTQFSVPSTPMAKLGTLPHILSTPVPRSTAQPLATPQQRYNTFSTPNNRPYLFTPFRVNTLPRSGTNNRTVQRRDLSDREAMKQLVDCVGMSARKRVLESGRKPRLLNKPSSLRSGSGTMRKELRFVGDPIPTLDYKSFSNASASLSSSTMSNSRTPLFANANSSTFQSDVSNLPTTTMQNPQTQNPTNISKTGHPPPLSIETFPEGGAYYTGSETDFTDSEGPPSPSPRTGSALSMSRRSGTPTATMTMTMMTGGNASSSISTRRLSGSGPSLLAPPLTTRPASFPDSPQSLVRCNVGGRKDPEAESREPLKSSREEEPEEENIRKRNASNRAGMRNSEIQVNEGREGGTVFKRRNSDGVGPRLNHFAAADNERRRRAASDDEHPSSSWDDYERLEDRLGLLIKEVDEIEERLAQVKLALGQSKP